MIEAAEQETQQDRSCCQNRQQWKRQSRNFQILQQDIADNEHGACIVAERQQITGFTLGNCIFFQKIGRYLAAHGTAAQETSQNYEGAIRRHPEETAEDGRKETGDDIDGSGMDKKVCNDQKGQ